MWRTVESEVTENGMSDDAERGHTPEQQEPDQPAAPSEPAVTEPPKQPNEPAGEKDRDGSTLAKPAESRQACHTLFQLRWRMVSRQKRQSLLTQRYPRRMSNQRLR